MIIPLIHYYHIAYTMYSTGVSNVRYTAAHITYIIRQGRKHAQKIDSDFRFKIPVFTRMPTTKRLFLPYDCSVCIPSIIHQMILAKILIFTTKLDILSAIYKQRRRCDHADRINRNGELCIMTSQLRNGNNSTRVLDTSGHRLGM